MNHESAPVDINGSAPAPESRAHLEFRSKFQQYKNCDIHEELLKQWGPISIHGALIRCPQYWLNHEAGYTDRGFELRRAYIKMLRSAVPFIQSGEEVPDNVFQEVVEGVGKDLVGYDTLQSATKYIGAVIRAEMTATKGVVPVMIGKMTAIVREFDRRDMLVFNNDITILGRYYTIIRLRTLGKFSDPRALIPEFIENNYLRALSALASCNGRTVRVNNLLLMPNNALMPVYWLVPCDFLKQHGTTSSREIAKYLSAILKDFPEKTPKVIRELVAEKGRPGCVFCQFRNEKNCANPRKA